MYLDLAKGKEPQWKRRRDARCNRPTRSAVDDVVINRRASQIGRGEAGFTRYRTRGAYQGDMADGSAYEFFFAPNDKEATTAQFRHNIRKLAEEISRVFCQDEVIVNFSDPKGNTQACAYGHGSGGSGPRFCRGMPPKKRMKKRRG